jgi:hypothetical protein
MNSHAGDGGPTPLDEAIRKWQNDCYWAYLEAQPTRPPREAMPPFSHGQKRDPSP